MLIPKVIIPGILLPAAHRSFVVSIYGCRKINIQPCASFAISRRFHRERKIQANSPKLETKTHFWDEIMKNLNRTEHEKRFVENFYGCLSGWKFWWIFFLPSANSHESPREGFGITSLREYQCRKIGLRSPMDSSIFLRIFRHAILSTMQKFLCLFLTWKFQSLTLFL